MRTLLSFIFLMLSITLLWAQAPEAVNYQAVARNNNGDVMASTNLNVRFTVRSGSAGGAVVYQETHFVNTNNFGLFTAAIGNGTVVSGTFSAINWSGNSHYLQVEVDPGSGFVDLGTSQLVSVPYALHAKSAANAVQYSAGSGIGISGTVISNTAPNVDQTLSISGNNLSISGGNTVALPGGGGGVGGSGTLNYLPKFTAGTTLGNSLVFDNGTNVGIGTTNPLQQFTVGGPTSAIMVGFAGSFNNVESGRLIFNEDISYASGTCGFELVHNGSTDALTIMAGCPTLDTIVRFTRSGQRSYFKGNVRFGSPTLLPSNPVSVNGNADISGRLGIALTSPLADMHIVQSAQPFPNPSTGGIILEQSGGTASSWQMWASNPYLSFAYNGTRVAYVNSTTGVWTTTSDMRLKTNISSMSSVIDRVNQLRPVTFDYNDREASAQTIGFIAQEVNSLFPEVVSRDAETPEAYYGIAYSQLSVIAIKAIQEQQAEIEALRMELEELRQMIRDMGR